MTDSDSDFLARMNAARVTLDDLLHVTEEVHNLPAEERDFEGRAILMIKLFPGEPDKNLAIDNRLQAMNRLIEEDVLPHWSMPKAEDGSMQIAEPVWQAAAEEPLLVRGNDVIFDKNRFLKRVLALAEPDGSA